MIIAPQAVSEKAESIRLKGLWHSVSGERISSLTVRFLFSSAAAMARRTHPIPYRTRKLSARAATIPQGGR